MHPSDMCISFIVVIVLSFTAVSVASDFKLSDSKLLLPYYSFIPVNYTLRGSAGACYTWYSGTPEVATVTPVNADVNGCSVEAVVTAIWQSSHRAVTTIYARVSTTGQIVKCDVIVDDIQRIEIETTTQELYIHNTPEALTIVAFDEYGNTFSTLEGVPFDWHIVHGDTRGTAQSASFNVLRFLTWTESEYVTPKSLASLELKGLQGYMQLVSGLRTGSAVVRVSLTEHVYRHVPMAQVRLLVLANAQLSPALAFLIPASRLKLQVRLIQLNNDRIIDMPSSQYHLRVNDSDTLDLDKADGSTVTALNYGQTEVTLLDRNVEEALLTLPAGTHSETGIEDIPRLPRRRLPTSLIYVVEPAYLGFTLRQHSSLSYCQQITLSGTAHSPAFQDGPSHQLTWNMELDQIYVIHVDVYDHNSHRIYPTDNLRLELKASNDQLKIIESRANGTYYVVQPIGSPGSLSIEAKLVGLLDKNRIMSNTEFSVTGSQDIIVHAPITITPSVVVLPWPTSTDLPYQLIAVGGSGQHKWRIAPSADLGSDTQETSHSAIRLTPDGRISALSYGTTTVIASSQSHPQICSTATVVISEPATIRFVPGPSEVVSLRGARSSSPHSKLLVGLSVLDAQGRAMTDCRGMDIDFRAADANVLEVLPERLEGRNVSSLSVSECVRVPVVGQETGFTELIALYRTAPVNITNSDATGISTVQIDTADLERHLQTARFPIAVYKEILFRDPVATLTYVALGSTRNFVYVEGPRPWPLDSASFFSRISLAPHGTVDASSAPSIVYDPRPFHGQLTQNTSIAESRDTSHERNSRPMTFTLRCESLGSFVFKLELGNRPSKSNLAPITMQSQFEIVCVVPHTMQLDLHRPIPKELDGHPACPFMNSSISSTTDGLWIPNTTPSLISLTYFDAEGHTLEAVDSVDTTISMLDGLDASRRSTTKLVEQPSPPVHYPVDLFLSLTKQFPTAPVKPVPYFFLTPAKLGASTGSFFVHVESKLQRAYANRITPNNQFKLEAQMLLRFISSVQLLPDGPLRIFHLLKSDFPITLVGGSGYYSLEHSASDHKKDDPLLEINPSSITTNDFRDLSHHDFRLSSKRVGQGQLRVIDLCYPESDYHLDVSDAYQPIVINRPVEVINLASLVVQIIDRIELGKETTAYVEALDSHGALLPFDFLRSLELRVEQTVTGEKAVQSKSTVLSTPDIIQVADSSNTEQFAVVKFAVQGSSLGTASLSVWTAVPGLDSLHVTVIRSNVIEIQVFAPLQLSPCNFNLLLGAQYELRASGGPSPASLEFQMDSTGQSKRAQVMIEQQRPNAVLISASGSPGSVTIRARSVSHAVVPRNDSHGAREVMVSEARCTIHVVAMNGIRIVTPLVSSLDFRPDVSSSDAGELDHFMLACDDVNTNCPGAPLWIESFPSHSKSDATTSSDMLTPMHMAGVIPHLRFNWRFNPPQPPSVARLMHYLTPFNVDVSQTHGAAGMVLIGTSPGRVTVHVTVESLDSSKSVLVNSSGRPVSQLHAQLSVVILPSLGMQSPPIQIAQQLLVSPESEYRLEPRKEVLQTSQLSYDLLNTTLADKHHNMISISPDGVMRIGPSTTDFHATVRVQSWPNRVGSHSSSRIVQTLFINVIVKPPRYVMPTAAQGTYVHSTTGLLSGGPYHLDVTFCDELGRVFAAVSPRYLQLQVQTHRTDLLQTQLLSSGTRGCHSQPSHPQACCTLTYHVSSPNVNVPGQSSTTLRIGVASDHPHLIPANLGPTFLTVPHGGEFDAIGNAQLRVAQWICLPNLVEGASWSSSDPSVFWVDSVHRLLLPRGQGKGYLMYTLPSSAVKTAGQTGPILNWTNTEPLSYMIPISSSSSPSTAGFVYVDSQGERFTGPVVLPILPPSSISDTVLSPVVLKFLVQFDYPEATSMSEDNTCPVLDSGSKEQLASAAPFYCSVRVPASTSTDSHLVPDWLSSLVLWNHSLSDFDSSPLTLSHVITSQLEPIAKQPSYHTDSTQWQCVLRTNIDLWYQFSPLLGLILQPKEFIHLQLKLRDTEDNTAELSNMAIVPLPGIQMIVPPALERTPGRYHFWINDPTKLSRRLLVFVPPATAAAIMSRDHPSIVDRIEARSSLPGVLEVSSTPRPVYSLAEVSQALKEYVDMVHSAESWWAGGSTRVSSDLKLWTARAPRHFQQLENELSLSPSTDSVVKRHVLWIVELKAIVGDSALDTVVDVVVSLRQTGQHLVVPVRVRLPSRAQLIESGAYAPGGFWPFSIPPISWFYLFILVFVTLMVAIIVHWILRSETHVSSSPGTNVLKDLPATTSTPPSSYARHPGSPQLWTHSAYSGSLSSAHSSPFLSSPVQGRPSNLTSPGIPRSGLMEEQKWRRTFSGGSPSRLRDTFDSI